MLFQVVEVHRAQEFRQGLLPFLQLVEELLGVRPGLRARPGLNMFLDLLPLLAVELQGLQKPEVLVLGPAPHFEFSFAVVVEPVCFDCCLFELHSGQVFQVLLFLVSNRLLVGPI